ncbi:MAG TPA: hypothetical protein VG734_25630 [Lacunisphaera sp.]|nr:hypothetical protein [Lacunisphaera sp.]
MTVDAKWHKRHDAMCQHMSLEPCYPARSNSPVPLDGWAIFTGCEGEDPTFQAFFVDEDTARKCSVMVDPDLPEDALFFDPCVVVAIATEHGIIAANDSELDTHEKLRAKIAESWWDDNLLVSGCIGKELDCGCPKCVPSDGSLSP